MRHRFFTRRGFPGVFSLSAGFLLATLLITGCGSAPYKFNGVAYDLPHPAPDFSLPAANGTTYHLADQHGHGVLLYFGYTTCPDICPITLAMMTQVKQKLGGKPLDIVFISVDPEHDTPQVMLDYVKNFDPSIVAISADKNIVLPLLQSYGGIVTYADSAASAGTGNKAGTTNTSNSTNSSSATTVQTHSSFVYLIDPAGNLRVQYTYPVALNDLLPDARYVLDGSR